MDCYLSSLLHMPTNRMVLLSKAYTLYLCQGYAERERSDPEWSGVIPEW